MAALCHCAVSEWWNVTMQYWRNGTRTREQVCLGTVLQSRFAPHLSLSYHNVMAAQCFLDRVIAILRGQSIPSLLGILGDLCQM